jgi:transcriptional regulator with XRE-family HTH domain
MYTNFFTPFEIAKQLADHVREKRLSLNMSQLSLAERSGVSLGALKKFEGTGKISLESLLKLAVVLGNLNDFSNIFIPKSPESFATLEELLGQKVRKRGRK